MQSAAWQIAKGKTKADSRLSEMLKDGLPASGVPLDELADDTDEVRALIRSGEARLEVLVSYWGLEFKLVARGSEPTSGLD